MNPELIVLNQYIDQAELITFFGGAGVSTESGIPDYRSKDGRYTQMKEEQEDPRRILNRRYIKNNPVAFFNHPRKERERPEPNMPIVS